jgi:hypothetical protein
MRDERRKSPGREQAPNDTHFGWLRSIFYNGTPQNPVRRQFDPPRPTGGCSLQTSEQERQR